MPGFKQLIGPVYRETLAKQFGPETKTLLILPDNVSDSRKSFDSLWTGARGGVAGPMRPNIVQKPDGTMGYDLHCVGVPSMKDDGRVPDESEVEASFERIYELLGTGAYTQVAVPYRNRSVHGGPTAIGTEPSFRGNIATYDAQAQKMFDKHFRYLEEFMNDKTLSFEQRLAKLPKKYQDSYKKGMQSQDKDPINTALSQPKVQQVFKKQFDATPPVAKQPSVLPQQLTAQQKQFRANVGQKVATKIKESGVEIQGIVFINNATKSTNIEFQFKSEAMAKSFSQQLHEGTLGEKISSEKGTPKVPFQDKGAFKVTLTAEQYEKLTTKMGLGTENKPLGPTLQQPPVSTMPPLQPVSGQPVKPNPDQKKPDPVFQAVLSSTTPTVTHAHEVHQEKSKTKPQEDVLSDKVNNIAHIKSVLTSEKCNELGIHEVKGTADGLHLKMKDPVTNVHIKEAKDGGVSYSADEPMQPKTIQQICDIALATAQPGTEFNLSGTDPAIAKEVNDYLATKIAQVYKDKPDAEKPKIVGYKPPEPTVEPDKKTLK